MSHMTKRTPMYGNCLVQRPDGTAIFRCDQKKVDWYLARNLAEVISERPYVVRLTFEPKGSGNAGNDFYLGTKENRCVVCGGEDHLTRHHIVPYQYRRWMPDEWKKSSSYDVLPLCRGCHNDYELRANKLKNEIARELNLIRQHDFRLDPQRQKASNNARALLLHEARIPQERQDVLRLQIALFLGRLPTRDDLESLRTYKPERPREHKEQGELVVERTPDLQLFVVRWRRHFVDTMRPKFMPEAWDVNFDHIHFKSNRV